MVVQTLINGITKIFTGSTGEEDTVERAVDEYSVGGDPESLSQDKIEGDARKNNFIKGITNLLSYPQTINTTEQPHSVNFTVKVREQSQQGRALAAAGYKPEENSEQNRVSAENLGGIVTAGATFGGAMLGALLTKNGSGLSKGLFFGAGGAAGYTIGDSVADNLLGSNKTIVTSDVITLYVPQSPNASYSADYQDTDLGLAGAVGQNALNMDEGLMGLAKGDAGEFVTRQLVSAADIGKAIGLNVNIRGAVQAATRKVTNPFKEQLFKTMNFREFGFEFKFAPKNDSELQAAFNIIKTFKFHMHPERTEDGLFLIYPSEFDIEFRYKGERNTFVNKISTCALVNMKVDYGAGGIFTTIRDTKGSPSEITMGLQFKELEILTKDRINEDY